MMHALMFATAALASFIIGLVTATVVRNGILPVLDGLPRLLHVL
jgi:hypothetical protein